MRERHNVTRALSVRQPWAGLIIHRYKSVENRSWPTSYRGRIAIHASGKNDAESYSRWMLGKKYMGGGFELQQFPPLLSAPERRKLKNYLTTKRPIAAPMVATLSAIVGSVEIVDCVDCRGGGSASDFPDELPGYLSPPRAWYLGSDYAWLLANPVAYSEPIRCDGKLNLWELGALAERVNVAESAAMQRA